MELIHCRTLFISLSLYATSCKFGFWGRRSAPPPHESLTTITSSVIAPPAGRAAHGRPSPRPPLSPPPPASQIGPSCVNNCHAYRTAETDTMAPG